jgi:hypothetical protein
MADQTLSEVTRIRDQRASVSRGTWDEPERRAQRHQHQLSLDGRRVFSHYIGRR